MPAVYPPENREDEAYERDRQRKLDDSIEQNAVLLRAIEESVYAGIYDLPQALAKAFAGGVLRGKCAGLEIAQQIFPKETT